MASKSRESALERARKIVRLMEGAKTESEAAAAALALQRLLASEGLELDEVRSDVARAVGSEDTGERSRLEQWERRLGAVLAANLRCRAILVRRRSGRQRLSFVGEGDDAKVCSMAFESMTKAARRCLREYSYELRADGALVGRMPTSSRNSYLLGFVEGIAFVLEGQRTSSESMALALITPQSVRDAVDKRCGSRRAVRFGKVSLGPSWVAERGYEDGSSTARRRSLR